MVEGDKGGGRRRRRRRMRERCVPTMHVLSDVCESCDETRVIIDWLITHQFDSE